jgi:hypothetical protein
MIGDIAPKIKLKLRENQSKPVDNIEPLGENRIGILAG